MHYFAYGSNMELGHMRRLCGWHCHLLGRARLMGFEIGIDKRGYGNIRPKQGSKVLGVLYDIDQEGMNILDEFEGYPSVFDRKEVSVEDDDLKIFKAWVYFEPKEQFGGINANQHYWQRVVMAAEEHKLMPEWVAKLRRLALL